MLVNNVKSVNTKYIFFINDDGKEDRKTTHYAELQEILDDLQSDYYFYNRMLNETEKTYSRINTEREKLENIIANIEKRIEENKDDPLVKRGLADICFNYEQTQKKHTQVTMQLSGIRIVTSDTRNKLERIERLINDIQAVMRVINK